MLAMFGLGGWEVVLIFAVILLLFGSKKLPELARGLGKGIKEFKNATREVSDEITSAMDENPPPPKKIPASTVPADSTPTAQTPPATKP